MTAALAVFLGGGLGSLLRYGISKASFYYLSSNLPLGTFISNILSCFVLAIVVFLFHWETKLEANALYLFLISGFCGGLSTFSTFSFETFELLKNQFYLLAVLNVVISLIVGLAAIYFIFFKTSLK